MLGKDHKALAVTFVRPADVSDGKLSGQTYRTGTIGAPLLVDAPAAVECRLISVIEQGDHHSEVVEAHLYGPIAGRPDCAMFSK